MQNYKKLKNGFSMAELLVALSIFAIISTMGLGAFSYMVQTQYKNQIQNEKDLLREAKISSCIKEKYYSSCTSQGASCNGTNIKNDCINKQN